MADKVHFKGTKKLEIYVRNLTKEMNGNIELACKELSVKSVMRAREEMQKKQMNLSGQLSESLIAIPGPYYNKKTGMAKIGFTQKGGNATEYGNVQEFGKKKGWTAPMRKLAEYASVKWGASGNEKWKIARGLQKKIKKQGIKGKQFGFEALNSLIPEIKGNLIRGMRDANNKAVSKAKRYNR